jgi:hypothetical protein
MQYKKLSDYFVDKYGTPRGILNDRQLGYKREGPSKSYKFVEENGKFKLMRIKIRDGVYDADWKDAFYADKEDFIKYQNMFGEYWTELLPKLKSHHANYPTSPISLDLIRYDNSVWYHIEFTCVLDFLDNADLGISRFKMLPPKGTIKNAPMHTMEHFFSIVPKKKNEPTSAIPEAKKQKLA